MNKLILLLKGLLLYPPLTLLIFNIILISFLLYFYHNKKTTITRETTLSKLVESFKISNIRNTLVILLIYFILTIGIVIKQIFTIEEKKDFLYKYLNYTLDKMTTISEEIKGIILSKVRDEHLSAYLQEDTSIQQICDFVENLPLVYFRLEEFYNHQIFKIQLQAKNEAFWEYTIEVFAEWFVIIVVLIVITQGYYYMTNKTKDLIISNNRYTPHKDPFEIIFKYLKSLFS